MTDLSCLFALCQNIVYRFYAKTILIENVDEELSHYSNIFTDYNGYKFIEYPCLEELYKSRIIVCTVVMASYFSRARLDKPIWSSEHFTHVVIDEVGCITEPMTFLPIADLCTSGNKKKGEQKKVDESDASVHSKDNNSADSDSSDEDSDSDKSVRQEDSKGLSVVKANKGDMAKIIIAGDTKQLEAVVRSPHANELGLGTPFMKKLLTYDGYTNNELNTGYFINNYRSYEKKNVMPPNNLFYSGSLIACAKNVNRFTKLSGGSNSLKFKTFQ